MRTGAARGHAGHFHEAGFYGSDTEFRALIVPFAEEGMRGICFGGYVRGWFMWGVACQAEESLGSAEGG